MTRDKILNMPAGREIDALVAEKVMGWRLIPEPSGEWFTDRLWLGLADTIYWIDVWNTVKTADINGYIQFDPSTDIAAAWQVVERLHEIDWKHTIEIHVLRVNIGHNKAPIKEYTCRIHHSCADGWYIKSNSETAPLAICRAALLAVMEL